MKRYYRFDLFKIKAALIIDEGMSNSIGEFFEGIGYTQIGAIEYYKIKLSMLWDKVKLYVS